MSIEDDVPSRYVKLYRRALSGRSRQAGVKAFCCMCMGWSLRLAQQCESRTCPLYPYRPRSRAAAGPSPKAAPACVS